MLVQALAAYADTYVAQELADAAFEHKPVAFLVELDAQGRFLGVQPHTQTVQRGKKAFEAPRELLVPRSPVNRNSQLHPLLGCDALDYVVGPAPGIWTKPAQERKHGEHHAAFAERVHEAARATGDPALAACARFYDDPSRVAAAREALAALGPRGTERVALAVRPSDPADQDPGGPVVERPAARDFWRQHYAKHFTERHAEGGTGMCLISGEVGSLAVTHEKVRAPGLGGQPSGVALMSFDKEAFQSYGWKKNANSPVSPDRALAYVLALTDLLRRDQHRLGRSPGVALRTRRDYGGMALLWWTRDPEDEDAFEAFEDGDMDKLLAAPWSGSERAAERTEPNQFYFLAVSCNGARLVVRDWMWDSLSNVRDNLLRWLRGLRVADVFRGGELSDPPRLYQLLLAIAPPHVDLNDKLNAERALRLARRALFGGRQQLGHAVLAAALGRLRVDKGSDRLRPGRIGLIRLCVNDLLRQKGEPVMAETLDEGLDHPAYLCGRLLAVYEAVQYQAHGGQVNVTVADRYYGMASTMPQLAFPRLETLSHAHLKKLRRDNPAAHVALSRRLDELTARLERRGARFPATLSLEEQGRFAVGYHCQRADDAKAARAAKARKAQEEDASTDDATT